MKWIIGFLLCAFFLPIANNALAVSWTGGKIIFWSYDRDPESPKMIASPYIMNADGTGVVKLMEGLIQEGGKTFSVEGTLSLSPDCQKAVFELTNLSNANSDIAVLEIDSRRMVNLTSGKVKRCRAPRWSPDGTQIVFSDVSELPRTLYIMNSDGTNTTMIGDGSSPDWSPDGRRIVFVRNNDIYTTDVDGGNVEKIVAGPTESVILLRWSPDSKRILFSTHRNDGDSRIYIMDSNGDNIRLIRESSWQACWSPDGKNIAFVATDDEDDFFHGFHIWLMSPDGGDLERLTNNDRGEAQIDWRDPVFGVSLLSNAAKTTWGKIRMEK